MGSVYVINLLVSFHYFLVIYINSNFLSQFLSRTEVGLLYVFGSLVSIGIFITFTGFLKKFGNYRFTLALLVLEMLALLGLAFATTLSEALVAFTVFIAVSPVIYLNLDVFLEHFIRSEKATGSRRGLFLTMINIAQVVCPFIAGLLLGADEFYKVYLVSLAFMLAALFVLVHSLRRFHDPRYLDFSSLALFRRIIRSRVFLSAFSAQFLLRFFYAWMVIYMPLYLLDVVGFSLSEIGFAFTIMLVPFLLLEYPLGKLADTVMPERTMAIVGFVIMALAVAVVPFYATTSFIAWSALLFITRIGASFAEVASESYFFKHVDGELADTISFFRLGRPATYVVAAIIASVTLLVLPFGMSFLVLAAVMLLGIVAGLRLRTR